MMTIQTLDIKLNRRELSQLINDIDPSLTQKHNRLRNKLQSLHLMLVEFPILDSTITTLDQYELKIITNPKYI